MGTSRLSSFARVGVLATLLTVGTSLAPGGVTLAHDQRDDANVDLAAIVLTEPDLAAAGYTGYGVDIASPSTLAVDAPFLAAAQGLDADDVEDALDDAGYLGGYAMLSTIPADADDPHGAPDKMLQTVAYLFEDADGAAAGYEVITDESQVDFVEDLAGIGDDLGDASEMSTWTVDNDPTYDTPLAQVELEILSGRLVLEVSTFDFDPATAADPAFDDDALASVIDLGETLLDRADVALAGEAPALLPMVVEVEVGSSVESAPYRLYTMLDGDPVRQLFETDDDYAERIDSEEARGTVSILRNEQFLNDPTDDAGEYRLYTLIQTLESEEQASDYLDGWVADRADNPRYSNVEDIEVAPLGDQVLGVLLETEHDGVTESVYELFIRVGNTVSTTWVLQSAPYDPELVVPMPVLEEIGAAQAACLENGACDGPVAMPDELAGIIED